MAVSGHTLQHTCPRDSRRHHKESTGLYPQRLADTGLQIIGTVHDEIILEVPDKLAEEVAVILKETMIEAGKLISVEFRLKWSLPLRTLGRENSDSRQVSDGAFPLVSWESTISMKPFELMCDDRNPLNFRQLLSKSLSRMLPQLSKLPILSQQDRDPA